MANATAAGAAAMQQAQAAAQQARNSLKQATQAMQAMQAAQNAARNLALQAPSSIPNGLTAGGLVVAPGAGTMPGVWTGARLPTQMQANGRTQVDVKQTDPKAILNWQEFNVGRETTVHFDQTAGNTAADPAGAKAWIALNRVTDPSGRPSQILGQIQAEGQVYVINRNGIVFGGTSQVNVGTLVASTLSLSNEQFMAGINNPLKIADQAANDWAIPQFGEHATNVSGQGAAFIPHYVPGKVEVRAGAELSTAEGGKLMLFGSQVKNEGRLNATDGQVILAAGEQVWLATDMNGVRGLDVAVSGPMPYLVAYSELVTAVGYSQWTTPFTDNLRDVILPAMEARAAAVGYDVTNAGSIHVDRGNITLQSREVFQNGVLTATSALNNREGSIRLRAWGQGMRAFSSSLDASQLVHWSAGTLTLGSDSVTAILPDLTDTSEIEQAALATRYKPGNVQLRGNLIDVQSFASVIAPSGTISAVASAVPIGSVGAPSQGPSETPIDGDPTEKDGSRIYIDSDAYMTVAGVQDVLIPMARNFIEAQLYINELRDSPLYRDSWLRGLKVIVDRRVSGTFEDGPMSGVTWIEGKPGQWVGSPLGDLSGWIGVGKTDLAELSTKAGSIVLKSGGSVITRAESMLDVSGGSVRYTDGWNNTTKLLGADGRVYDIGSATPDMIYVGLAGGYRRDHARWGVTEIWTSPLSGARARFEKGYTEGRDAGSIQIYGGEALILDGSYWGGVIVGERQAASGQIAKAGTLKIGSSSDPDRPWTPSDLIITGAATMLPADFTATTPVSTDYYRPGVWPLPEKTTWLNADILSQSGLGKLDLFVTNAFTLESGTRLELDPGASLSVTSNGSVSSSIAFNIDGTIHIAGGTVSLGTAGAGLRTITLGANANIDVSGQWVNELTGVVSGIAPMVHGGTINLSAMTTNVAQGAVLDVSGGGWVSRQNGKVKFKVGDAGKVTLPTISGEQMAKLELRAFAAGSGGSLAFETRSSVQLGGSAPADASVLYVPGSLYAERGFRSVTILSYGDITVPDGSEISQLPVSVDLSGADYTSVASGTKITDIGTLGVLRLEERAARKPAELILTASGGNITVGAGAHIRTDLGGHIAFDAGGQTGSGNATIHGTVEAPAGSIAITAAEKLLLSNGASLLARGAPVIYSGPRGYRIGEVRAGGSVSVEAMALLTLEAGSLIDVSGASGEIDVPSGGLGGRRVTTIRLASNGGSISISGFGTVAGTLSAHAGGEGAAGGSVRFEVPGSPGGLSPRETFVQMFGWLDPDCLGLSGNGVCDNNLQDIVGFDYGPVIGLSEPVIFTQEMIDALPTSTAGSLILSETAAGPNGGIDLGQLGLTPQFFGIWRDMVGADVEPVWQAAGLIMPLVVRPSSISSGGFADLVLQSGDQIQLQGANLALSRSISINGTLANVGGLNSLLQAPHINLNSFAGGAAADGSSLAGRLTLSGSLIEISQTANIRGFAQTVFEATDLRLSAPLQQTGQAPTALLDVEGALVLKAGQIYPSTGVQATIKATGTITVARNGEVAPPLSAGGSLTLEAPVIEQNGVLRAPFGQIILKASERLTLGSGSITSVSGNGLIVPYGVLSNGEHWIDPTKAVDPQDPAANYLAMPPEKRVVFDAPTVNVGAGSTIDIRGGGDLYAREFVPGPGGSHDIVAMPNTYAVLPGFAGFAPSGSEIGSGDRVWLAGGNGLAAGWYTLLPASYAALPGAYLVSLSAGAQATPMARAVTLNDGSVLMNGRRSNELTGTQDQLSSSWRVMSGAQLRQYSEYNEAYADSYFASDAFKLTRYRLTGQEIVTPRLPMDGGAVVFKATQELILDGRLQSQAAAGGRGGLVDIAGTRIAIVGAGQDTSTLRADGYLVVDANQLTNFGAGSLLIGGTRTGDPRGLRLDVTANDIIVRNDDGSILAGPEIILAASSLIDIHAGSVISASGEASGGGGDLVITPQVKAVYVDPNGSDDGDPKDDVLVTPSRDFGALIRLSNGDPVKVIRENVDTSTGGIVKVGTNVQLAGGNALLIDATRNTELAASARLSGSALSVASGRIGLGGGSEGLILSSQSLAQLANTQHLTLRSYTTVDFYSSVEFGGAGLATVTLDAGGLVGYGANHVAVTGKAITLQNSGETFAGAVGAGSGSLTLTADELVLGAGSKVIGGFGSVVLAGLDRVVGEGRGSIDAGSSALTVSTPVLTGRSGANQSLVTTGALTIGGDTSKPLAGSESSLGTRLALSGGRVRLDGRIVALGGAVDLTATAGNLVLADGSLIDVGGFAKQFFDVTEYADAGRIGLTAIGGDVRMSSNAALNLSAHAGGGNAGNLSVTASGGGTVVLDGRLAAKAGVGGKGGSFALDIAALPDFAGLSQRLNEAGFFASRQFRIRNGDVTVSGTTTVADFSLGADRGVVTIAGVIDARAQYGGRIVISGGNGLVMESSAALLAGATDAELGSGRVTLEASAGELDLRGGTIDVSGGEDGRVRLRALQTAAHDEVAVTRLDTRILGARSAVLEGVSVYDAGDTVHASAFDGVTIDSVMADAKTHAGVFMDRADAVAARLGLDPNVVAVAAGIEIRAAGDLALNSDWNLFTDFAARNGGSPTFAAPREGTLTLRAAGNLTIKGNLSDGFDTADRSGQLQGAATWKDAASWNLRLVAGADLTSAGALAVTPLASLAANSGYLIVGDASAGKLIRTGTGDIDVRVARNVDLANNKSVIYTAGRKDMTTWPDFTSTPTNASFGIHGGHVSIAAQGSITSALPTDNLDYQLFTEWLWRQGGATSDLVFAPGQQSAWWVNYGTFQQGVGALGGGNVSVDVGGDLVNLLVAQPTNARVRGGRTFGEAKILEMRNGGAMTVNAGGVIRGGQYYIGRGAGSITAGELAIGRTVSIIRSGMTHITSHTVAPVLALGDATLDVRTMSDMRVQTVLDPLLLDQWRVYDQTRVGAFMSGYTARTALNLTSVGGDMTLVNDGQALFGDMSFHSPDGGTPPDALLSDTTIPAKNRYPAITHITALNGSLEIGGPLYTMAGANAELRILVENDVRLTNSNPLNYSFYPNGQIFLSRAVPDMMPSPFLPYRNANFDILIANDRGPIAPEAWYGSDFDGYLYTINNPDRLPMADDYEPSRIYALSGSIVGERQSSITTNEQTWFRTGKDIRGINYSLRNIRPTDVSLLEAGNDIIAAVGTYAGSIRIEGPGALLVTANHDVYGGAVRDGYGGIASLSIVSTGNRRWDAYNRPMLNTDIHGLPEESAAITLLAGLNGKQPSYAAFMTAYLDPANVAAMPDYLKTTLPDGTVVPLYLVDLTTTGKNGQAKIARRGLVSFVEEMTGERLSPLAAWNRFRALPQLAQEAFLRRIYMQELRDAGRDYNTPGPNGSPLNGGYDRGYAAIATLFPGDDWNGDVVASSLMLRGMAGGDIEVLTPGGGLQVAALGAAVPPEHGIITLGSGHINIFAKDDVTVNRSRILTFVPEATAKGSDMIIWSTLGDIDAGRGAKTLRVPTAPDIVTDPDGNTEILERQDMSGSGIGTVGDGDVDLVAPKGTVNAGDAGIRVAGNLNLAALYVLNVGNIQVGGESKGVPKPQAPSNLAAPVGERNEAGKAAADASKAGTDTDRPSIIIVELLGFGGSEGGEEEERQRNERQKRSENAAPPYNPRGPVRILGVGRLTEEERQSLSEDERQKL
ncbi:filamentous haemagglutinin family protein [Bradyrhizobium sp. USDA 10063]